MITPVWSPGALGPRLFTPGFFAYDDGMTEDPKTIEEEIAELMQSNGQRINVLGMQNIGVDMDTLTFRHLIETLFPTEAEREAMNLSFQKRLAKELTDIEANVDRINLERSAQSSPGLIVPDGAQT